MRPFSRPFLILRTWTWCQCEIRDFSGNRTARETLVKDWHLFELQLGEWTDADANSMDELTLTYCSMLPSNVDDRFPEPRVLSAFRISDVYAIPETREDRNDYADADNNVLSEKFLLQDANEAEDRLG